MNSRRSSSVGATATILACLAAAFVLASSHPPPAAAASTNPSPKNDDRGRPRRRRRLTVLSDESIASAVQNAREEYDDVVYPTSFVLNAEVVDVAGDASADDAYELVVREALPAISSATTLSVNGVPAGNVHSDVVSTMLVSDVEGILALISVDVYGSGNVRGIIRDDTSMGGGEGTGMRFVQDGEGGTAKVDTASEFTPPAWSCGFGGGERDRHNATEDYSGGGGDYHRLHDHDDGHHRDDDDDDENENETVVGTLFDLHRSLRGSTTRLGKPRRMQNGGAYAYWVDVYIEIDYSLCNDNGETCANGIGPNTINYVNALFVGANTIYETEINTHLHVLLIDLNTNYDASTNTMEALTAMRSKYARTDGWHYTSPSGIKPDLHHALLSKNLGGGIAYLGTICNPNYGFGLSASLNGNYRRMGNAVVWDMMVFMHELGHNFNSGHTHDGGYSPRVDTCGCPNSNGRCSDPCPAQLPLAKSATIMSYCHLCSGGYDNIDYTFGGKYSGTGSRSSIYSYSNSPLAGAVSAEPRQVNAKMWSHVSTRGTCTQPYNQPITTTSPTNVPTMTTRMPTSRPTPPPTTRKPTSIPTPLPTGSTSAPTTPRPTSIPTPPPTTPRPTSIPTPLPKENTQAPTTQAPTSIPTPPPTQITSAPTSSPSPPTMTVEVLILTDDYPGETTWTLVNQCGQQTSMRGGPYNKKRTWVSVKSIVPSGSYLFTINDVWADGLCCGYGPGSYKILVNGIVKHTSNGKFTRSQTQTFGSCVFGQSAAIKTEHVTSRRKKGIFGD